MLPWVICHHKPDRSSACRPKANTSFCHVCRHIPDQAVVDMNDRTQDALDTAVAAAVQCICKMMLHVDILVVQIAA